MHAENRNQHHAALTRTGAYGALALLLVTTCVCSLQADGAGVPVVEITRLDGRVSTGRLTQVGPEIKLETDSGGLSLAWTDVLSIRPQSATSKPAGSSPQSAPSRYPLRFELADGSAFAGEISGPVEQGFAVRFGGSGTCRLELAMLRAIEVSATSAAGRAKLAEARAELAGTEAGGTAPGAGGAPGTSGEMELSDVAVVARGQEVVVLRGRVRQVEAERATFEWNGRELSLPWGRVVGLLFARPVPRAAACLVRLVRGDAFAGRVAGGSEQALLLRSGIFNELELAWSDIERIDCRSERLVFLSDLKPARYEFQPFFDKTWDYAADRTLSGGPIRLGGQEFARGVCMHSRASLVYAIGGRYERFAAVAGIVDEMDSRGCVGLRVLGDGRVLWEAAGVRGGQPPREVVVDVRDVQELVLVVDYDQELDLSDEAAWGSARLIK